MYVDFIAENRKYVFRLFVCFVCLFGVYSPTREFFTHIETSPLPVKDCKFCPMLGTQFRCGFCPGNVLGVVNLLAV